MQYHDTVQRSTELLRQALPLMSRQAAALHPQSYALWYAYVARQPPALRSAVDAHLARHGALDEAATAALYHRFLAPPPPPALPAPVPVLGPATAQRVAEGMQRLLMGMSQSAEQAGDQTRQFGQTLQRVADELQVDSGLAAETGTLDTLRLHTDDMQAAMALLQQRLAESQREIDNLRAEVQQARQESLVDALTGLPNRRAFDQRLGAALLTQQALPDSPPLQLLMLDIDHFKRINDQYGHPFGDQVLRGLAQVLQALVKPPQLAARVGGEEFAVLLPGGGTAAAVALAERLRAAIAGSRIRRKGQDDVIEHITVSLGVASSQPGDTPHSLLDRADRALYLSKAGGRDRVTVAD